MALGSARSVPWRHLATFTCALIGGTLSFLAAVPLPWVIGSMFGVAMLTLSGRAAKQPLMGRRIAQITIGTALGLYFTPEVIQQVASLGHWMVIGALFSLLLTALFAPVIQKLAKVDGPTAIYSVAVGASAEMSVQAQKAGANAALVASAQAIRIILVVTSASFIAHWSGTGTVPFSNAGMPELPWQYAVTFLFCAPLCGWLLHRLGLPNAWVLGPIFLSGAFAAYGLHARLYQVALIAAQVMIGWGLGQHMTRKFFLESPRVLVSAAFVTAMMITLCVSMALALHHFRQVPMLTTFLSLAPGGMAEMAIVAKTFGIGAPIVTAFHFFRILSTIFMMKWLGRLLLRSGWVKP